MLARIARCIGWVINAWKGPSVTTVREGPEENSTFTLAPTVNDPSIVIGVRSKQIVYHTHYSRPWIPDRTHMVFEVVGYAPEDQRHLLDPALFVPVIFPLLCHRFLQWTHYPHVYAIHAYLDRIWPYARPSRIAA